MGKALDERPGTVLVTGAAGFVGSHLLHTLVSNPHPQQLVAWRRPGGQTKAAGPSPPRPDASMPTVEWREVDLLDTSAVHEAIESLRPTRIYHCAGAAAVHGSWANTVPPLEGNVRGTDNLLRAVATVQPSARVLIPGSALVYRPADRPLHEDDPVGPVSPYGWSKLAQEMLAERYVEEGLDIVWTRSFTHIGPGQATAYAASSFAHQIACIETGQSPPLLKVGSLDARRDLTDVRDTVQAYVLLSESGRPGQPYNVCSGTAFTIREVLDLLISHARVRVTIEVDESRLRPGDNPLLLGDPSKVAGEVGWHPHIPLSRTLKDLLDSWRQALR